LNTNLKQQSPPSHQPSETKNTPHTNNYEIHHLTTTTTKTRTLSMTDAVINSHSRSPLRFWKVFNNVKQTSIQRKKTASTKRVSFTDHDPTEVPTDICLTPAEEDTLWWTDDELDLIMYEAQSKGDLESFKENIRQAQLQITKVLKEQERQRNNAMLDPDEKWKSTARVSRRSSSDAQCLARTTAIEHAKTVAEGTAVPSVCKRRSYSITIPAFRAKGWLKVGPMAI
jgi:hypothetical protein